MTKTISVFYQKLSIIQRLVDNKIFGFCEDVNYNDKIYKTFLGVVEVCENSYLGGSSNSLGKLFYDICEKIILRLFSSDPKVEILRHEFKYLLKFSVKVMLKMRITKLNNSSIQNSIAYFK